MCVMLVWRLTMIPSVMKRMAPPRACRMKKVAGRPRSLAGSQQPNQLTCPGGTGIQRDLSLHLNSLVTSTHTQLQPSITLVTVLGGTRVRQRVLIQQTWAVVDARQQFLVVHESEHHCRDRELAEHTKNLLLTNWTVNTSCQLIPSSHTSWVQVVSSCSLLGAAPVQKEQHSSASGDSHTVTGFCCFHSIVTV